MVHHDFCPFCSSSLLKEKFISTDNFVSKETFPIVRCEVCGFTFTQDHPSEKESGRYYESENYISHSNTSKGIINRLYFVARSYMLRRKASHVTNSTGLRKGKLLDIGSGTGYFPAQMKKAGWEAEGIEINQKAREFSKKEFNLKVSEPSEIGSLETGSYDCITLWHVLEHFHNPGEYMKEISRLLKPDGRCIIALPNSSSYDASHYKEYWAAWDVPRHLWHFTPSTVNSFLAQSGFEMLSIKSLPLDVFYISLLSEKYKQSGASFIKGILKGTVFFFKSAFFRKKSSSLVYILRKAGEAL
ncbi:MAG TPA: class I SAM-dependent methyltransferase [Bacteroidales bacterium]|nr:class I SAM-dependent methyltransferase [Bacteroidales bacterium]